MGKGRNAAKRLATVAILVALSLITFIIENQFPPLFFPGARMGLANVFSLAALIIYTPLEAFLIVAVRTALGAVFAGNVSALLYSFTGGVAAMAVSSVLVYLVYPKISVMATSIAAAVAHNITQNLMFILIMNTPLAFGYMPYLAALGVVSGAIVGGIILIIFRKTPESVFLKAAGLNDRGKNVRKDENQI